MITINWLVTFFYVSRSLGFSEAKRLSFSKWYLCSYPLLELKANHFSKGQTHFQKYNKLFSKKFWTNIFLKKWWQKKKKKRKRKGKKRKGKKKKKVDLKCLIYIEVWVILDFVPLLSPFFSQKQKKRHFSDFSASLI